MPAEPAAPADDPVGDAAAIPASRAIDLAIATGEFVRRHLLAVRLLTLAVFLALLVMGAYRFTPTLEKAQDSLADLRWGWVAVAFWAQMITIVQLARLQRSMLLTGGVRVSLRRALPLAFASNALSVTLPGGTLISSVYSFKRMRRWGASQPLIAFGLVVTAALSGLTFAVIAVVAATLAGEDPSVWTVALEIAAAVLVALGLRSLIRRPALIARIAGAVLVRLNRLRSRPPEAGSEQIQLLVDELTRIHPRGRDWLRSTAFASLNWLFDVVCLFACLRAVGLDNASVTVALVAYAAGVAASAIPITPGGLGLVDGALIFALIESHLASGQSAAAVVIYRLFSLVIVVLIGWIVWAVVHHMERRAT